MTAGSPSDSDGQSSQSDARSAWDEANDDAASFTFRTVVTAVNFIGLILAMRGMNAFGPLPNLFGIICGMHVVTKRAKRVIGVLKRISGSPFYRPQAARLGAPSEARFTEQQKTSQN